MLRSLCTTVYACELWWTYGSESLRKLCVLTIMFLCSEPIHCTAHMFVSRGLPTRKMVIRKSVYCFTLSIKRSCNTSLQNIVGMIICIRPRCPTLVRMKDERLREIYETQKFQKTRKATAKMAGLSEVRSKEAEVEEKWRVKANKAM